MEDAKQEPSRTGEHAEGDGRKESDHGKVARSAGRLTTIASWWEGVRPRIKGVLLLLASLAPAGAAGYVYPQWEHPFWLSVNMWVPILLFPASILLAVAGVEYLRGRRDKVLDTAIALPGPDSPDTKVRDVSKWLNFSTVGLFACRVGVGWTFWWGATEKHPWNAFGWLKDWLLRVEVEHTPFPWYREFLQGTVAPNFEAYGWFQFIVELLLGLTLILGLGTRLAGIFGGAWGAIIYFGNWGVPSEPWWILSLIFLAPLAMAGSRAGRALGTDMLLQPWLGSSRFRVLRWVARWMM